MRLAVVLLFAAALPCAAAPPLLELKPHDHICIIGNTLADRMQHDGWFETFLQASYPNHNFVVRNLGFSGDEITTRLRSANFGTPDEWLSKCKADVIFAFFGYNESFAGEAGLPKFKADLELFIKSTLAKKYNGKSAPRLVLFSPLAHEDLKDRRLPDGKDNNRRLAMYSSLMSAVAKEKGVGFVDVFSFTRPAGHESNYRPIITMDGVHLNDRGSLLVAARTADELLGDQLFNREHGDQLAEASLPQRFAALHSAVNDKNFYWFERYRTTDGYSIFGGRADLKFVNGQTNREVAQREMLVLDIMTANRDKVVWAAAQGKTIKPDDSNLPPFIPVITNKPGAGPNGTHIFLSGEDEIKKMTVGKGLSVNLFASEEQFPELAKPVQMSWDAKGRLWVAVWPSYPHWKPTEELNDKILIFEDTKGTGKADKMTVFADHLTNPTGFEFYNGGVIVAQAPDLMFLKDTKGTGKADFRERILHGLDSADTHHTANSFALDPGGALYFQEGTFHHTQVETPWGPPVRNVNAGVYRFEPNTYRFEAYVQYGFANPHGHAFDAWGQDIVIDGTGSQPYHAALFSGHLPYPQKHSHPPQVYEQRTRPCPGIEILSSQHFPEEFQGNLLVGNVIGFQGILRYRIDDDGASFHGTELEPILSSSDPNFRPSDMKIGPDGALYFIDWHNPIIGHMQHNLRDPSRDRTHGRIYRVTYNGRPLSHSPEIAGQPVEALLELLKHPETRVRSRARGELGSRKAEEVLPAVDRWLAGLNKQDPNYEHERLEGLWVHQWHDAVNATLLGQVLKSPDFRARAAAVHVLCYQRHRIPEALDMLRMAAADPHPRVRLEAVRAASFFPNPEAIEVVIIAGESPTDKYLDFVSKETMRTLQPIWKAAVAAGVKINYATDAGRRFAIRNIPVEKLATMDRTPAVLGELLTRPGVSDDARRAALHDLAKLDNKSELKTLVETIHRFDAAKDGGDSATAFDLVRLMGGRKPAELAEVRSELETIATHAHRSVLRQAGYVALTTVDSSTDRVWQVASRSAAALTDFLGAVPMLNDPGLKARLYPKILPLLDGPPTAIADARGGRSLVGRYVRIEIPGKRKTLSLAEVQVFSDGHNVARAGKANQKNTAYGGSAGRAIDGKTSGRFADGSVTHSAENTDNPWWEVDLGAAIPIDSIVVWNRTDEDLGNRLANFSLIVLDANRQTVHRQDKLAAPKLKSEFALTGPAGQIRRAAMLALVGVRGKEAETFTALAKFVKSGADRDAAIRALQRLPRADWPKNQAKPLIEVLASAVRQSPPKDRTSRPMLDALEFADALASLLPAEDARKVRRQLGELGVRVVRVGTLPERMAFDKEVIAVQAGKPVEFLFENVDLMPHNFVIISPGSLEPLGNAGEASATDPDAAARNFVPKSPQVLLASTLLQPNQSQRLPFTAPTQPGVYPYVCTYPGHWRNMHGALYVVKDLEAYQAGPETYLAANPVSILDPLLKDRRPRTEWKYDDLAQAIAETNHGRSYAQGKQMFQVANCVACHKLEGVGQQYGPDLTQFDAKWTTLEVWKEMIDPSARINEKFQSFVFQLSSGQPLTGLIVGETADAYKVVDNPIAGAAPRVIKKDDVERKEKSPISLMPKGLLDKLSRDEILDLVAYVYSRGNKNHAIFGGEPASGHGHGH